MSSKSPEDEALVVYVRSLYVNEEITPEQRDALFVLSGNHRELYK